MSVTTTQALGSKRLIVLISVGFGDAEKYFYMFVCSIKNNKNNIRRVELQCFLFLFFIFHGNSELEVCPVIM